MVMMPDLIVEIEKQIPSIAKLIAFYRDELTKNGFTREEAIMLLTNFKVGD